MSDKTVFTPTRTLSSNDSLLLALFVAAIIHVAFVLGTNFTVPQTEKINKAIDITLVNIPTPKAPPKANFLAQDNQVGAGDAVQKKAEPPAQQLPSIGAGEELPVKKTVPKPSKPQTKPVAAPKVITQAKSEKKVAVAHKQAEDPKPEVKELDDRPHLTAEALQQKIAQYVTEIRQRPPSAEESRIKFVNSVSAHKYLAAQYMQDWESKVERTGNLNYPEVAAKMNFSGTLTMDVGIKADGSIYSIRISRSSGNPALDEAAKKIVRMSAPFPALPLDLRKELDVLVMSRVWRFSDQSGFVAH
ncbi:MAG: energy transducer TonB [Methylococcaceae bacterium]|nr:energy transducer TonB [Methylococcaceae bacterium]